MEKSLVKLRLVTKIFTEWRARQTYIPLCLEIPLRYETAFAVVFIFCLKVVSNIPRDQHIYRMIAESQMNPSVRDRQHFALQIFIDRYLQMITDLLNRITDLLNDYRIIEWRQTQLSESFGKRPWCPALCSIDIYR